MRNGVAQPSIVNQTSYSNKSRYPKREWYKSMKIQESRHLLFSTLEGLKLEPVKQKDQSSNRVAPYR